MRQKVVQIVASLLAVVVLVGVFGCSSPTPSPTPAPSPTSTPTASPKPSPAPTTTAPAATTPAAKPVVYHMRVQSWGGEEYLLRVAFENVMKDLKATGKFTFDYFPKEQLMTGSDSFDGVRQGVLDMAIGAGAHHKDRMKVPGEVRWYPGNWKFDKFAANARAAGSYYDWAQPTWNKYGLRLVVTGAMTPAYLQSRKSIKTLEDFQGKLFRNPGVGSWPDTLGATSVPMKTPDVYEALMRGTVDCDPATVSSYLSQKWYEVAPYYLMMGFFSGGMDTFMNLDVYKKWPADIQKLWDDTWLKREKEMFASVLKEDERMLAELKGKGVTITYPSDTEVQRWFDKLTPYNAQMKQKYGAEWDGWMTVRNKFLW